MPGVSYALPATARWGESLPTAQHACELTAILHLPASFKPAPPSAGPSVLTRDSVKVKLGVVAAKPFFGGEAVWSAAEIPQSNPFCTHLTTTFWPTLLCRSLPYATSQVNADANHKIGCNDWGPDGQEGLEGSLIPMAHAAKVAAAVVGASGDSADGEGEGDSNQHGGNAHCHSEFEAQASATKKNRGRKKIYSALQMTNCCHGPSITFLRLLVGEKHKELFTADLFAKAITGGVKMSVKDIACRLEKSYMRMNDRVTFLHECVEKSKANAEFKWGSEKDQADAEVLEPFWGADFRAIACRPSDNFPPRTVTEMKTVLANDKFHLYVHADGCWYLYGIWETARKHSHNEYGEPSQGHLSPGASCEWMWRNDIAYR
jgi:hypothetical protein